MPEEQALSGPVVYRPNPKLQHVSLRQILQAASYFSLHTASLAIDRTPAQSYSNCLGDPQTSQAGP